MALTQVDQGLLGQYAQYTGFKNRIINGAMMIDQRNAGASVTPTNGQYLVDRWFGYQFGGSGKYTAQQTTTAPSGFVNSLKATSTSAYTVGATDIFALCQAVEGLNVSDFAWGTASAATVTLSFRVYSSLTGTFGGCLQNSGATRNYPFTYSIPVANTWTTISLTIAGDTTGTWLTTNGVGMTVLFGLGVGSTYSGAAGAWSGTSYYGATGATSVVGTSGATFYITGVQLEKGSTATSFDYRPYGTELALCYRYYRRYTGSNQMLGAGYVNSSSSIWRWGFTLDIPMRVVPTVLFNTCVAWAGGTLGGTTTVNASYSGTNFIDVDIATSGLGVAVIGGIGKIYMTGASNYIELSGAEL